MTVFKQLFSVGFVGATLIVGAPQATSAAPRAPRAVAAAGDDAALKSEIAASFKKNSSLAPRDIDVDVNDGVVTLKGEVRTEAERARAGKLALVKGVARVDNRIEINPKIDQSKIEGAGEKTKAGVTKAVDATVNAARSASGMCPCAQSELNGEPPLWRRNTERPPTSSSTTSRTTVAPPPGWESTTGSAP